MANIQFTPEEMKIIDGQEGRIINSWPDVALKEFQAFAKAHGCELLCMNTSKTIRAQGISEPKRIKMYDTVPQRNGFQKMKVTVTSKPAPNKIILWGKSLSGELPSTVQLLESASGAVLNEAYEFEDFGEFDDATVVPFAELPSNTQGYLSATKNRKKEYTIGELKNIFKEFYTRQMAVRAAKEKTKKPHDYEVSHDTEYPTGNVGQQFLKLGHRNEKVFKMFYTPKLINHYLEATHLSQEVKDAMAKFFLFCLEAHNHFELNSMAFILYLVDQDNPKIWYINELQSDMFSAFNKVRHEMKGGIAKSSWETMEHMLIGADKKIWADFIGSNVGLRDVFVNKKEGANIEMLPKEVKTEEDAQKWLAEKHPKILEAAKMETESHIDSQDEDDDAYDYNAPQDWMNESVLAGKRLTFLEFASLPKAEEKVLTEGVAEIKAKVKKICKSIASHYIDLEGKALRPFIEKAVKQKLGMSMDEYKKHAKEVVDAFLDKTIKESKTVLKEGYEELTNASPIDALDFEPSVLEKLKEGGVTTVGELVDQIDDLGDYGFDAVEAEELVDDLKTKFNIE